MHHGSNLLLPGTAKGSYRCPPHSGGHRRGTESCLERHQALEAYLQGLDAIVPFRHSFGKFLNAPDEDVHGSIECSGTASGEVCEEALVWGPDSKGRFRLQYEVSHWEGSVDIDAPGGPWFWDSATLQRDIKPLIETPFETRKKMYRHLPDFVTSLARELDINDPQITVLPTGDEIPF